MIGMEASVSSVKTKIDMEGLLKELQALSENVVLVGVPEERDTRDQKRITPEEYKMNQIRRERAERKISNSNLVYVSPQQFEAGRKRKPSPKKSGISNAALAYIHDNGAPSVGIPARPFMKPGIAKAQNRINGFLMAAAKAKMAGDLPGFNISLHKTGLAAQSSIKRVISAGEGFAPLKRSTLLGRTRSTKSRIGMWKGDKGKREEIMSSLHPLVDTGQLRNSITYVVVDKESGSRQVGPVVEG